MVRLVALARIPVVRNARQGARESVGSRKRPKEVVERAVFFDDEDQVLEGRRRAEIGKGLGENPRARGRDDDAKGRGDHQGAEKAEAAHEFAPRDEDWESGGAVRARRRRQIIPARLQRPFGEAAYFSSRPGRRCPGSMRRSSLGCSTSIVMGCVESTSGGRGGAAKLKSFVTMLPS